MKFFQAVGLSLLFGAYSLRAQATAFTYQGRLTVGGVVTNGSYDLKFSLFTTNTGGAQVGGSLTNAQTAVSNGVFTVALNFGSNIFTGAGRWLELGVRPGGSNSYAFTPLAPRQQITAAPYALYAANAGSVNGGTLVASNSTTLGGTIQFAGNSAAPGYVWTATDANGNGQWVAAPSGFNATNLNFYANNGSSLADSGWEICPTNILSTWPVSGLGAKWFAMTAPISNVALGHWGEFRAVSSVQANSYGDPLGDLTYNFGFNQGGDAAGMSSYGPTATNMPHWSKQMETSWQNYAGLTQMEDWWNWGAPYTQWGTNAQWRYFGANLVWDSVTKQYVGSDGGFHLDNFYIGGAFGKAATPGAYGFQVNDLGDGGKQMKLYGIFTTYTNSQNSGGVQIRGGSMSVTDVSNSKMAQQIINGSSFVLSGAGGVDMTVQGFTSVDTHMPLYFYPGNSNEIPLTIIGVPNQNAQYFRIFNHAGDTLASVDKNGLGYFVSGKVTDVMSAASLAVAVKTVTTNYSMSLSDSIILVNAIAGPVTVTLPDCSLANIANRSRLYKVMKKDSSANVVTVNAVGGVSINSTLTRTLGAAYAAEEYFTDGTTYFAK
ncbi:MAG: hypothetical protein RL380_342 [Verrucomicrobiota bacterium]